MMKSKVLSGKFCGEAINTAVYLLHMVPTSSVVGMTPYEAWYGRKPSVDHLRTFRCMAHVKTVSDHNSKLADQSTPMIMTGYEEGSKAYRLCNPYTNKVVVTRDVVFEEERSWNWDPKVHVHDELFHVTCGTVKHAENHDQPDRNSANSHAASASPSATPRAGVHVCGIGGATGSSPGTPPRSTSGGRAASQAASPGILASLATSASTKAKKSEGSFSPASRGAGPDSSPVSRPSRTEGGRPSEGPSERAPLEELGPSISPGALSPERVPCSPCDVRQEEGFGPENGVEELEGATLACMSVALASDGAGPKAIGSISNATDDVPCVHGREASRLKRSPAEAQQGEACRKRLRPSTPVRLRPSKKKLKTKSIKYT